MSRIANKTGKLNKPYRDPSVYHNVRRGRKPKLWKTTTKARHSSYKSRAVINNETPKVSPTDMKTGCLITIVLVVLITILIVVLINVGKKESPATTISLEELLSNDHPQVADDDNTIKAYYKKFNDVEFSHISNFEYKHKGVLVWYHTSQYGDHSINTILMDFSKLNEQDKRQLTFEKVLDVAMTFIPVDEIVEYYYFDKAIYVERKDHIAHEVYYKEDKNKIKNRPTKYFENHGFSMVIKEYSDGKFTVAIDTNWYDSEYDRDSIFNGHITQEEIDAHQKWEFTLDGYKKQE